MARRPSAYPLACQRRHGALGGSRQLKRQEIECAPLVGSSAMHDMEIAARRADTIVAQQGLDGWQVNPRFQERRGKGMPEAVNPAAFADPRPVFGDMINMVGRRARERLLGPASRKEPQRGAVDSPVAAQFLQQSLREQRVTILTPFALG